VTWQDKCYFSKHIKEDESLVLLLAVTYVVFVCLFSKIFPLFVVKMVSVQYLLYRITEILED
jgi:hypothetical protein